MKHLLALLLFLPVPALAENYSQRGYSQQQECFRDEYREEYIPGTKGNPGYVKTYHERVAVPCNNPNHEVRTPAPDTTTSVPPQKEHQTDDNSCIEGSILGGIAGGAIGAGVSRGDGRWWAIPTGIVAGSMVGCQIDGG